MIEPAIPVGGRRLIILGGGISALTAAFHASEAGWQEWFPGGIHVYERTNRLGGKGASSRGGKNHWVQDRIEEHGLHVWFGFYENAFGLLARCHRELDNKPEGRWATSLRDVGSGFRRCSRVAIMDHEGATWRPWVADFPEYPDDLPWRARTGPLPFGTAALAARAVRLLETVLRSLTAPTSPSQPAASYVASTLSSLPQLSPLVARLGSFADRLSPGGWSDVRIDALRPVLRSLTWLLHQARQRVDEVMADHDGARRSWYVADLLLAALRGMLDDGVLASDDFEVIDGFELREWLVRHGASAEAVSCGLLKALVYNLAFAYDGDPDRPRCSAATGVYGLLRVLLTYRGAIMWKMNAGMGEIVFAPLYEALLARNVTFHFEHEVTAIQLEPAGDAVRAARIELRVPEGAAPATPLPCLEVTHRSLPGRLPYWPRPQAPVEGDRAKAIDLGVDDVVIYGMPVSTIETVLRGAGRDGLVPEPWQRCAREVKTVATVAMQLWLTVPVERLAPWATPDVIVAAYTEPFDTWSDMDCLIGERLFENDWRNVRSVAYFTNVAHDGTDAATVERAFIADGLKAMWPGFDPQQVLDRYTRVNEEPSERYALSLPGTMAARLRPNDGSIVNMRPVGDWTRNILNAGCIEAAVISGMLAVRELRPDVDVTIVGERSNSKGGRHD